MLPNGIDCAHTSVVGSTERSTASRNLDSGCILLCGWIGGPRPQQPGVRRGTIRESDRSLLATNLHVTGGSTGGQADLSRALTNRPSNGERIVLQPAFQLGQRKLQMVRLGLKEYEVSRSSAKTRRMLAQPLLLV